MFLKAGDVIEVKIPAVGTPRNPVSNEPLKPLEAAVESIELYGHLHYLHIGSPSPSKLASFYSRALGMDLDNSRPDQWLCRGPSRRLLFSCGQTHSLIQAGFVVDSVDHLEALSTRLSQARCPVQPNSVPLLQKGSICFRDPDGNEFAFGLPAADTINAGLAARLQHIVLGSPDLTRARDFYTGIVGFRETDRVVDEHGVLRTVFLRSDHEHHSLAIFQTTARTLDHHCYESSDWNSIRDWGDRFAKQDIRIQWGPGRHGPGNNLFLFVHDPDGNWLEISAELEVVSERRPVGTWPHSEKTLNSWGAAYLRS